MIKAEHCRNGGYIWSIQKLLEVVDTHWAAKLTLDPKQPSLTCIDYLPPPKSSVVTRELSRTCMPRPLTSCHMYTFTPVDRRRQGNLMATTGDKLTMSGIWMRQHMLPGRKSTYDKTVHPRIKSAAEAEAEVATDDETELAPKDSSGLHFKTEDYKGWKVSFRKTAPELCLPEDVANKIERTFQYLEDEIAAMPEGRRLRSLADVAIAAREKADRKNANQRARNATLEELYPKGRRKIKGDKKLKK